MMKPFSVYCMVAMLSREPLRWRKTLANFGQLAAITLLPGDFPGEALDVGADRGVLDEQLLDLADRVEHRRVVLASEVAAELLERGAGELAAQVDADLARLRRRLGPAAGVEVAHLLVEVAGDDLLDLGDGHRRGSRRRSLAEHLLRERQFDRPLSERRVAEHLRQRP